MDSLPLELMSGIAENLNLRDAENMYLSLTNDKFFINKEIENTTDKRIVALNERIDPRTYLKKLTPHPQELLNLMEEYRCTLAGECVLPFFFPNRNVPTNHWRIVCSNNKGQDFIKKSKNINMMWRIMERSIRATYIPLDLPADAKIYIGFSRNFYGQYVTVELVDSYTETPLCILSTLPTTFAPCFISGSIACYLRYPEAERNEVSIRVMKLLRKYSNKINSINSSCNSCSLITNIHGYNTQAIAFDKLLAMRYVMCIYGYSRETSRHMILDSLYLNPECIVPVTHGPPSITEIADAFVAECTCNYNDGTELINEYKNMGLKLKERKASEAEEHKVTDIDSYLYKFRNINNKSLSYIYNNSTIIYI